MTGQALTGAVISPLSGAAPKQLVVLCHGIHAGADQLEPLARDWANALRDAAFAFPEAPLRQRQHWLGPVLPRRREWFSIRESSEMAYERGARYAADLLNPYIDRELARLKLPADAYVMAGFSQGAMLVLFAGLRRTVPPRAIICLAGALIGEDTLACEIANRPPPVLLIHGVDDPVVPLSASKYTENILRSLNVPLTCSYIAKLRHEIGQVSMTKSRNYLMGLFCK